MKPKISILLEGLTYRLGDFAIGAGIGFGVAYLFTHDFDIAAELGSIASLIENVLNTFWYWLNRRYWTKETAFKH